MIMYNYQVASFLFSIPAICNLPNDKLGAEIAFVGYSNSGKSSVINALTNSKKLTKVSRTPGNTKYINFFEIKKGIRLIDFPGYGYSKTSKIPEKYWYDIVCQYLKKRENLRGLILIMDIRHAIKCLDYEIIQYALMLNIPILTLLNKSDKLSKCTQQKKLQLIKKQIKKNFLISQCISVEVFSSVKKYGIESMKKVINFWLSHKKI